ncbi:MAG: LysR family transcriptional regulator, partial [Vibrio sp.]
MVQALNPTWLNTFKTLVEVGHFTQTADKLFMTQPGVTQHIQKLEAACGHALIIRENKSFSLTEQGRLVYDYACQQAKSHQALTQALSFDDETRGRCVVGCSGSMALAIYPEIIKRQLAYPQLEVALEAAPNQTILSAIEQENMDIGIVTSAPNANQFEIEHIGKEILTLVLPQSFKQRTVSVADLFELGMIRHPDADHYLGLYLSHHQDPSFQQLTTDDFPTKGSINQLQQILLPVSQGLG